MTDRDDSSEGFLERWSRRKIDAERTASPPSKVDAKDSSPASEVRPQEQIDPKAPVPAASKPQFDLASLPSLDSITAITDIRAFLAPGVPADLARAALRRAWSSDPAIRDFKGLAENDWDFTDPSAMTGFGELPPGTDIKKVLAQIFGEGDKPVTADPATQRADAKEEPDNAAKIAPSEPAPIAAPAEERPSPPSVATGGPQMVQSSFVQRDNNTAAHNNSSDDGPDISKHRRHHGGALPQ